MVWLTAVGGVLNIHIHPELIGYGRLDERWLGWFEGHTVEYLDDEKTVIVLTDVDQPALFGVLSRIRDLGLELISVRKEDVR